MSLSGLSYRRLIASLLALFAALSLVGKELALCSGCVVGVQYLTYIGIFYFLMLSLVLYFCRTFPNRIFATVGLVLSALLAFFLTLSRREICPFCVTSHALHIAVWSLFVTRCYLRSLAVYLSVLLVIAVPLSYLKERQSKVVGKAPAFSFKTKSGKVVENGPPAPYSALVLHFIQEGCPYCKEQVKEIENIIDDYPNYLFYHVSTEELHETNRVELIVSKEISQAFHINLFPTLVIVDQSGNVTKIVRGRMPENTTLAQFIAKISL